MESKTSLKNNHTITPDSNTSISKNIAPFHQLGSKMIFHHLGTYTNKHLGHIPSTLSAAKTPEGQDLFDGGNLGNVHPELAMKTPIFGEILLMSQLLNLAFSYVKDNIFVEQKRVHVLDIGSTFAFNDLHFCTLSVFCLPDQTAWLDPQKQPHYLKSFMKKNMWKIWLYFIFLLLKRGLILLQPRALSSSIFLPLDPLVP